MNPLAAKLLPIKGAKLQGDQVLGSGFLIQRDSMDSRLPIRHRLVLSGPEPFAFLFGLTGLGYHHRLDIRPKESTLALYHVRDGIPLYLHHFSTHIPSNSVISIDLFHSQIRIGINGFQVMHTISDPRFDARIGFSPLSAVGFNLPTHSSTPVPDTALAWLTLGDGFSNARWRNRNFLSWPECVFGHREDWFNGCVAAGNSRRLLELAKDFAPLCDDTAVLLAVGSDDQIEGETYEDFEVRLLKIIQILRTSRLKSIHLSTLPPRASALESTRDWSIRMKDFAVRNQIGILDFNTWLSPHMEWMVRGEYPGARAQQLLALRVAETLGLQLPTACPEEIQPAVSSPMVGKVLHRVQSWLDKRLANFPGVLQ